MKFKKTQKLTTDILPPHNFFILALKPIGAKGYFYNCLVNLANYPIMVGKSFKKLVLNSYNRNSMNK